MTVQLTPEQTALLLRLVEAELAETGTEIHHTRTYKDPLKAQKTELRQLRDALVGLPAAASPATCQAPAVGLLGTP